MWASVVVAHRLSSCSSWALEQRLHSCGAGLSGSTACGTFPDQGLNPNLLYFLHWQADSLQLAPTGKPQSLAFWLNFQAWEEALLSHWFSQWKNGPVLLFSSLSYPQLDELISLCHVCLLVQDPAHSTCSVSLCGRNSHSITIPA